MKVIKETIGDTTVLIQTLDEPIEIVGEQYQDEGPATEETGITDQLRTAYDKVKQLVKDVASDIGSDLKTIDSVARPNQIEMEFSIGVSVEGNAVWLVSGKGEYGFKVTMTWELNNDGQTA